MNRRHFAKAAVLLPFGLALTSTLVSQEAWQRAEAETANNKNSDGSPNPNRKRKTAKEYNQHQPIEESDPFAGAVSFNRKQLNLKREPFGLNEVVLDSGLLQQAREWNRIYMMRLPNDRLLHNFRINAGLPSGAIALGGWEAPGSELRGHFVGHYLSAAALLHASTGDTSIKQKADELVAGIAECQSTLNRNGYVSAFPEELFERLDRREKVWAPFYTLHKIMAGLLDMHTYAGNLRALDVVVKLAGWVDGWTASKSEEHMQDILKTEFGGMNDVLYNLAATTGDDRWARTGDQFTKRTFFNPLAIQQDELKGLHANTHIPQVIGAASRYELSSDSRFRDLAEFFWETITESRTYATGGSSNSESWLTNANRLSLEMRASSHHQECCCAYNMMKLTRHLYSWTGDSSYIDYYERNLFNHRLGTIEPETGHSIYFLSMSPGAWKTTCTEDQTFWCCTGTALEDFSKLNDTIYYHDENDIYVNLFVPSQVHWKARGIHLKQVTSFPESDRTVLSVQTTPLAVWTMYLRVPMWTTAENSVRINGGLLPVTGSPGSYIAIRRKWRPGDRVEFVIPMKLTVEPLRDDPNLQAFLYGPVVLAEQFPLGDIDFDLQHNQGPEIQELSPLKVPDLASRGLPVEEWIKPVPDKPLTFHTCGQLAEVTLEPLNQNWQRFAVYFKVT